MANAWHRRDDDIKISITFLHSEVDREGKLAIVQSLLHSFDMPHIQERAATWEFIRGKVSVILKLEKIEDPSVICHPFLTLLKMNND